MVFLEDVFMFMVVSLYRDLVCSTLDDFYFDFFLFFFSNMFCELDVIFFPLLLGLVSYLIL